MEDNIKSKIGIIIHYLFLKEISAFSFIEEAI